MASRRLLRQRSAEDIVALEVSAEPVAWMTDDVLVVSFLEMKVDHPREDMPIHVGRTPHLPGELRQRACDVFMTENRSELQRKIREGPRPAHDQFTFRQLWRRLGVQRFHALDHDSMQVYVEKVLVGRCRRRNPLTGRFQHRAEGNLDDMTGSCSSS
jgi:hypothetical protein